jgi:hypothetical protein
MFLSQNMNEKFCLVLSVFSTKKIWFVSIVLLTEIIIIFDDNNTSNSRYLPGEEPNDSLHAT